MTSRVVGGDPHPAIRHRAEYGLITRRSFSSKRSCSTDDGINIFQLPVCEGKPSIIRSLAPLSLVYWVDLAPDVHYVVVQSQ